MYSEKNFDLFFNQHLHENDSKSFISIWSRLNLCFAPLENDYFDIDLPNMSIPSSHGVNDIPNFNDYEIFWLLFYSKTTIVYFIIYTINLVALLTCFFGSIVIVNSHLDATEASLSGAELQEFLSTVRTAGFPKYYNYAFAIILLYAFLSMLVLIGLLYARKIPELVKTRQNWLFLLEKYKFFGKILLVLFLCATFTEWSFRSLFTDISFRPMWNEFKLAVNQYDVFEKYPVLHPTTTSMVSWSIESIQSAFLILIPFPMKNYSFYALIVSLIRLFVLIPRDPIFYQNEWFGGEGLYYYSMFKLYCVTTFAPLLIFLMQRHIIQMHMRIFRNVRLTDQIKYDKQQLMTLLSSDIRKPLLIMDEVCAELNSRIRFSRRKNKSVQKEIYNITSKIENSIPRITQSCENILYTQKLNDGNIRFKSTFESINLDHIFVRSVRDILRDKYTIYHLEEYIYNDIKRKKMYFFKGVILLDYSDTENKIVRSFNSILPLFITTLLRHLIYMYEELRSNMGDISRNKNENKRKLKSNNKNVFVEWYRKCESIFGSKNKIKSPEISDDFSPLFSIKISVCSNQKGTVHENFPSYFLNVTVDSIRSIDRHNDWVELIDFGSTGMRDKFSGYGNRSSSSMTLLSSLASLSGGRIQVYNSNETKMTSISVMLGCAPPETVTISEEKKNQFWYLNSDISNVQGCSDTFFKGDKWGVHSIYSKKCDVDFNGTDSESSGLTSNKKSYIKTISTTGGSNNNSFSDITGDCLGSDNSNSSWTSDQSSYNEPSLSNFSKNKFMYIKHKQVHQKRKAYVLSDDEYVCNFVKRLNNGMAGMFNLTFGDEQLLDSLQQSDMKVETRIIFDNIKNNAEVLFTSDSQICALLKQDGYSGIVVLFTGSSVFLNKEVEMNCDLVINLPCNSVLYHRVVEWLIQTKRLEDGNNFQKINVIDTSDNEIQNMTATPKEKYLKNFWFNANERINDFSEKVYSIMKFAINYTVSALESTFVRITLRIIDPITRNVVDQIDIPYDCIIRRYSHYHNLMLRPNAFHNAGNIRHINHFDNFEHVSSLLDETKATYNTSSVLKNKIDNKDKLFAYARCSKKCCDCNDGDESSNSNLNCCAMDNDSLIFTSPHQSTRFYYLTMSLWSSFLPMFSKDIEMSYELWKYRTRIQLIFHSTNLDTAKRKNIYFLNEKYFFLVASLLAAIIWVFPIITLGTPLSTFAFGHGGHLFTNVSFLFSFTGMPILSIIFSKYVTRSIVQYYDRKHLFKWKLFYFIIFLAILFFSRLYLIKNSLIEPFWLKELMQWNMKNKLDLISMTHVILLGPTLLNFCVIQNIPPPILLPISLLWLIYIIMPLLSLAFVTLILNMNSESWPPTYPEKWADPPSFFGIKRLFGYVDEGIFELSQLYDDSSPSKLYIRMFDPLRHVGNSLFVLPSSFLGCFSILIWYREYKGRKEFQTMRILQYEIENASIALNSLRSDIKSHMQCLHTSGNDLLNTLGKYTIFQDNVSLETNALLANKIRIAMILIDNICLSLKISPNMLPIQVQEFNFMSYWGHRGGISKFVFGDGNLNFQQEYKNDEPGRNINAKKYFSANHSSAADVLYLRKEMIKWCKAFKDSFLKDVIIVLDIDPNLHCVRMLKDPLQTLFVSALSVANDNILLSCKHNTSMKEYSHKIVVRVYQETTEIKPDYKDEELSSIPDIMRRKRQFKNKILNKNAQVGSIHDENKNNYIKKTNSINGHGFMDAKMLVVEIVDSGLLHSEKKKIYEKKAKEDSYAINIQKSKLPSILEKNDEDGDELFRKESKIPSQILQEYDIPSRATSAAKACGHYHSESHNSKENYSEIYNETKMGRGIVEEFHVSLIGQAFVHNKIIKMFNSKNLSRIADNIHRNNEVLPKSINSKPFEFSSTKKNRNQTSNTGYSVCDGDSYNRKGRIKNGTKQAFRLQFQSTPIMSQIYSVELSKNLSNLLIGEYVVSSGDEEKEKDIVQNQMEWIKKVFNYEQSSNQINNNRNARKPHDLKALLLLPHGSPISDKLTSKFKNELQNHGFECIVVSPNKFVSGNFSMKYVIQYIDCIFMPISNSELNIALHRLMISGLSCIYIGVDLSNHDGDIKGEYRSSRSANTQEIVTKPEVNKPSLFSRWTSFEKYMSSKSNQSSQDLDSSASSKTDFLKFSQNFNPLKFSEIGFDFTIYSHVLNRLSLDCIATATIELKLLNKNFWNFK